MTTENEWQEYHRGERAIADSGEPALQQMQPLLRRHAGRLGRLACSVAYDTLAGSADVPVVFSSRYGEVSRSVDLLSALAAGEELSPASFGLSVHNAITGLFGMARRDSGNTISLAAGDESAEYGVLEACSLLADGHSEVLLVVADVPLPEVYTSFADTAPSAFAWACRMRAAADAPLRLDWSELTSVDPVSSSFAPLSGHPANMKAPGALAVLNFLQGDHAELTRQTGDRHWRWRRND